MKGLRIVERDYLILQEIFRWRIVTGRHIKEFAGFTGQRACDRRLAKLIEADYIYRKKILYGFPYIYNLTSKGKTLLCVSRKSENIRVEQILHDSSVADTAIYVHRQFGIEYKDMTTEKELHGKDGFSCRNHRPDFIFKDSNGLTCVEVELSMKSKSRFERNIKDNFTNYDNQLWVVPNFNTGIYIFLESMQTVYPNIQIIDISEVKRC